MPHLINCHDGAASGIACLAIVARFHALAADCLLTSERIDTCPDVDTPELLQLARSIGLKAKNFQHRDTSQLSSIPLPAIVRLKGGKFAVLAGVGKEKVLLQDPAQPTPLSLPLAVFRQSWGGELIVLGRRSNNGSTPQRFGWGWFMPAVAKYRHQFSEILLASFFLQLFALATPLFFQVVIDKVLVHRGLTTLDVLALGLLVISLFDTVVGGLRSYLLAHTTNRIDVSLGTTLFRHLLHLPLGYFNARRVGDTVARVRELDTIRQCITGASLTAAIDLFFTLVFLVIMYCYSPGLFAIVLATIPCYIFISAVLTPLLRRSLHEKFQRGAANQAFLVEAVNGIDTIKSMAVESEMLRHWEDQLAAYVSASFRSGQFSNIANQVAGLVSKLCGLLVLWHGATLVIGGALTVGQLVAFNIFAGRVSAPVLRLVQLWQDVQQTGIAIDRLADILDTPTEPGYRSQRSTPAPLRGRIELEEVSFRYQPDSADAIQGIDLCIEPGEIVGIVGRSGSGKSTVTRLIQRLHLPSRGKVRIDGADLALVRPDTLRRQIGVVQQDSYLFNRSVRDNIALAEPGADLEKVTAAARIAGAHEFICDLPEGYDTLIGEQGNRLSGGQRQRLAIARALMINPRILIFDEATSALDYESEYQIQRNMALICHQRTVLIIAHRLSTVRQADRIIVMDKGRIIEQGNHQQLIGKNGAYAKLYAHQSGAA